MNLCSNGHEEVCYECRNCPVCDKMQDIKFLEEAITRLENKEEIE